MVQALNHQIAAKRNRHIYEHGRQGGRARPSAPDGGWRHFSATPRHEETFDVTRDVISLDVGTSAWCLKFHLKCLKILNIFVCLDIQSRTWGILGRVCHLPYLVTVYVTMVQTSRGIPSSMALSTRSTSVYCGEGTIALMPDASTSTCRAKWATGQ